MIVSDHQIGSTLFRQRAPRAKPEPAITIATYLYFIEQLSVAINYGLGGGSSVSRHVIFCFPYLSNLQTHHSMGIKLQP